MSIHRTSLAILAAVFAFTLSAQATHLPDAQIQADIQKSLGNSRFKDVQVTAANGVVTLSGSVALFGDKQDADKKAHHHKDVSVRDEIEVAGVTVPDIELFKKLSQKVAWDRVGYNEPPFRDVTPFNAIQVAVNNGTVILSGNAYSPIDKDSALTLVKYYPGVKNVIDDIQVDPPSFMDDRIRMAEFRAIYSDGFLSQFAIDPGKDIRITVINGHVILSGIVDTQNQKNVATIRANSVGGIFQVVNNLVVVGQPPTTTPTK
jgi:osmotically-inducible protein OsmY